MTLIDYINNLEKGTLIRIMKKNGHTQWEANSKVNKLLAGRLSNYIVEKVKINDTIHEIYLQYYSDRYDW